MGITIAYRGQLADFDRIEDLEDRLVDLALEIGAMVQVWRTWADDNPERMVRGVILRLVPGQESASLLVSPEGWLIGLTDIEDAENGRLEGPPWCFVKTQFGPVEGHVALVEMLAALKGEFLPELEVSDDGGYWETRDFAELDRRHSLIEAAIAGLADGLRRHGLSREAAEDPSILLRHIERVAEQVHRTLRRPAEHPRLVHDDDGLGRGPYPEATEALRDALLKQNRAIREESDEPFEAEEEPRLPLLQRAMDLLERLDSIFGDPGPQLARSMDALYRGARDAIGGLAQAMDHRADDAVDSGLRVVQLKRALRGAAFARGALFPLRSTISTDQFDELFGRLQQMEKDILSELGKARCEHGGDGWQQGTR